MADVRRIDADGVPGLLYTPDAAGPFPLVLVGHGGGGGKDQERFVALSKRICDAGPFAVLVIDGPVHGERAPNTGDEAEDFRTVRKALVDPDTPVRFTEDWRRSIDAVAGDPEVDATRLGYCGFSMGVLLGVPVVAGLGTVRAAVFGVGGVPVPGGVGELVRGLLGNEEAAKLIDEEDDAELRGRIVLDAAAKLTDTDVLMINMSQDVVFPVSGALELFAALPGPKRMMLWEGGHVALPPESIQHAIRFLRSRLNGATDDTGPGGIW